MIFSRPSAVVLALVMLSLSACGGGSRSSAPDAVTQAGNSANGGITPQSRYDMANGCYALQSVAKNSYAVRDASGAYAATAAALTGAEAFFMKPSALGSYLIQARDKTLLAVSGAGVGSAAAPSSASDWTVNTDAQNRYTLVSIATGKALAVDNAGKLVLADAAAAGAAGQFSFVPSTGCTAYPELADDVVGAPYKGQGVDKPVIGFAEVHTHMAMSHEMSDGSGNIGPSAGGTLYGQMFNRYGVVEALKNCETFHGPDGIFNGDTVIHLGANTLTSPNPLNRHDTQGWPTFIDWPSAESLVHQGMYYTWVKRAYKAGLRILVSHGTNIDSLCQVGRAAMSGIRPENLNADCDDMSLGFKQDKYMLQAQDYIDAQEGGPGKGWFRIVKSPAEARAVINDGKLAVVLGLEFAHMFNCKVTVNPDGSESSGCDKAEIDHQINEIDKLGVRQLFPFHDINSSLGGTGIFNGSTLNALGFYDTHEFWKTYDCPAGGEGDAYFYPAGSVMTTAIPGTGNDPISAAVIPLLQGPVPIYKPDVRQCNARGLTELGHYALQQLMKRKFIIDIDHAELSIKSDMIAMAKAQTPTYPLISAHGGHGGISTEQARDILNLGGLIYPYKPNGKGQAEFVKKIKPLWPAGRPLAVGYGSDTNGFGGLAGPRGAGSVPVKYPFTLFQGEGWGPQFAAAGIKPVTVNLETVPESGKSWNVDEVGMAHYGMVADYVEETRIEGGKESIDALYNSAEAYLQMWERTVNR
jgi:hypothetical protein